MDTKEIVYPRRSKGAHRLWCGDVLIPIKKSKLAVIKENIKSQRYQEVLNDYLIPFLEGQDRSGILFQQDNAKPHISESTRNWLQAKNIKTMYWPAYSQDLNPIENAWAELSRAVYSNGKTYTDLNELEKLVVKNWDLLSQRYLKKLVDSMETRIKK